jgi:hypothetical protein
MRRRGIAPGVWKNSSARKIKYAMGLHAKPQATKIIAHCNSYCKMGTRQYTAVATRLPALVHILLLCVVSAKTVGSAGFDLPMLSLIFERKLIMSEEATPQPNGDGQNVQLIVDDRDLRTTYTNGYFINQTAEEVVVDFGFNMPRPAQNGQPQVMFKLTDRIVLSYPNAKRLAGSLLQLIKRYEQQFGEIPTQPGARR